MLSITFLEKTTMTAKKIRALIEKNGIKQGHLARKLKISDSALSLYLRERRSMPEEIAEKLVALLT
jgi:transcriptional regulator with XRE-family HTH domain